MNNFPTKEYDKRCERHLSEDELQRFRALRAQNAPLSKGGRRDPAVIVEAWSLVRKAIASASASDASEVAEMQQNVC